MTIILKDEDLGGYAMMGVAIDAVEKAFAVRASGEVAPPPRHHVAFPGRGVLVFTGGGVLGDNPLAGVRIFESYVVPGDTQLVPVWSADDAELKGLFHGKRLGTICTGAIGGVAFRHMSAPDARVVGVVGSGPQARTQLAAAVAVRDVALARVYSRDAAHRAAFAEEMQRELGIAVEPVGSVREAVGDADIVILARSSPEPVVAAADLKPGAHVNTLGPKDVYAHELALDVLEVARVIATDSRERAYAYAVPFFLEGSAHEQRMVELSDIVAGKALGRATNEDITLFCSVGLAGTEVVVASAIFDSL